MKIAFKIEASNPGESATLSQVLEVAGAFTEAGHPLPEVRAAAHRIAAELATEAAAIQRQHPAELQPEHFRPVAAAIADLLEHGEHFKPAADTREGLRELAELLKVAAPKR